MTLSSYSTKTLEDVIAEGRGNPYMMHICIYNNRSKTVQILQRAEAAGFKAAVVSVDIATLGIRLNEYRNDFNLPEGIMTPMLPDDATEPLEWGPSLTWTETIPWLRKHTTMEIRSKGILSTEDVSLAIEHGIDGIIIFNHGGGVPASLDVLRGCAPVAKTKIKLAIDGGIRQGSDIFKALALGADFCFAGRIPIWGLAYNDEDRVDLALKILLREFETTMALCGCKSIRDISRAHLSKLQPDGILCRL